jgi:uncharacterized protein (UPF0333 family)
MKKRFSKGQAGIELIIFIIAILLFFTMFFLAINDNSREENIKNNILEAEELGLTIKNELNLASSASEGYIRTFKIPEKLGGLDYEIDVDGNNLYIHSANVGVSYSIINFSGQIKHGENVITKKDGTVYIE